MDARLATVRSGSWEAMNPMQQLGAWATSEEEPKPRRGARRQFTLLSGGPESEDPVARACKGERA